MQWFNKLIKGKKVGIFHVRGSLAILEPHKQDYPFNIDLQVDLLENGIQLSMSKLLAETIDPMNRGLIRGMFHTMAPVNQDLPFVITYGRIDDVYAFVKTDKTSSDQRITELCNQLIDKDGTFIIWLKYHNVTKGIEIALGLQAYNLKKEIDPNLTKDLFNSLLTYWKESNQ